MDEAQLCEFCGDAFGAHEFVIHACNNGLLEGPYLCEFCGDGFNSRCQVEMHNREQHPANMSKKIRTDKPCNLTDRNQSEHSTIAQSLLSLPTSSLPLLTSSIPLSTSSSSLSTSSSSLTTSSALSLSSSLPTTTTSSSLLLTTSSSAALSLSSSSLPTTSFSSSSSLPTTSLSRNNVSDLRTPSKIRDLCHDRPLFLEARAHASFMPRQNGRKKQASQQSSRPLFLDAKSFVSFIPSHKGVTAPKSTDSQSKTKSTKSHSQLSNESNSQLSNESSSHLSNESHSQLNKDIIPDIMSKETCLMQKGTESVSDTILNENILDEFLQGNEVRQNRDEESSVQDTQNQNKITLSDEEFQINVKDGKEKVALSENESQTNVHEEMQGTEFQMNPHGVKGKSTVQGAEIQMNDDRTESISISQRAEFQTNDDKVKGKSTSQRAGFQTNDDKAEGKSTSHRAEFQTNDDKAEGTSMSQGAEFQTNDDKVKGKSTSQGTEFQIDNDKSTLPENESQVKDHEDVVEEIDVKPVICNICKVAFNSTDDINIHIDCFHGDYPYKCVICYSVYQTLLEINEHLKTEHNIKQENTSDGYLNTGQVSITTDTQCHGNVMDTATVANVNQDCKDILRNIMSETVTCSTVTDFKTEAQLDSYMAQIDSAVASCVSEVMRDPIESPEMSNTGKNIRVVAPHRSSSDKTENEMIHNVHKRTRGRNARIMNRQVINVNTVNPLPVIFYTCSAICYMCTGEKSVRFGCLICPKIFFTCTEVMYHQNKDHKLEIYGGKEKNMCGQTFDGVYIHACNACNAVFHNLEGLIGHDLDHHLQMTKFKCKFSQREFQTKEEFYTHFKLSVMKNLASTCPVTYINNKKYLSTNTNFCPICGSSILDYAHFKTHVERLHVSVPQQFDCWICGDTLCGDSHKVDHIAALHKVRSSYICVLCKTNFSKTDDLQCHHDNTHNDLDNIFTCSICNSVVKCSYMKQHYEVDHGISKLYDCKFCNNVFLDVNAQKCHQNKIHYEHVHESYNCHICQEELANFPHFHLHFHSKHIGNFYNSFNIVANLVYSFSG